MNDRSFSNHSVVIHKSKDNSQDFKHNSRNELFSVISGDISDFGESKDFNKLIQNQRKTITDLTFKYNLLYEDFQRCQKQLDLMNQNEQINEDIKRMELRINELEKQIELKDFEFESFKKKSLNDIANKDNKLLEAINKVSDLEDMNYKLTHFNSDKKKFAILDRQVKDLSIELQKTYTEIDKLKKQNNDKDLKNKDLLEIIKNLENNIINMKNQEFNEVSFACQNQPFNNVNTIFATNQREQIILKSNESKAINYNFNIKTSAFNCTPETPDNITPPKIISFIRGGNNNNSKKTFFTKNFTNKDIQETPSKYELYKKPEERPNIHKIKLEQEMKMLDSDEWNNSEEDVDDYIYDYEPVVENKKEKSKGLLGFLNKFIK